MISQTILTADFQASSSTTRTRSCKATGRTQLISSLTSGTDTSTMEKATTSQKEMAKRPRPFDSRRRCPVATSCSLLTRLTKPERRIFPSVSYRDLSAKTLWSTKPFHFPKGNTRVQSTRWILWRTQRLSFRSPTQALSDS